MTATGREAEARAVMGRYGPTVVEADASGLEAEEHVHARCGGERSDAPDGHDEQKMEQGTVAGHAMPPTVSGAAPRLGDREGGESTPNHASQQRIRAIARVDPRLGSGPLGQTRSRLEVEGAVQYVAVVERLVRELGGQNLKAVI